MESFILHPTLQTAHKSLSKSLHTKNVSQLILLKNIYVSFYNLIHNNKKKILKNDFNDIAFQLLTVFYLKVKLLYC